jgi:hypothetical protein
MDDRDESTKWEPHGGVLFCERVQYNPYQGVLYVPGKKNQEAVFKVLAVGEGVNGYAVGDLLVVERCFETVMGCWVREAYIYGKLPFAKQDLARVNNDAFPGTAADMPRMNTVPANGG